MPFAWPSPFKKLKWKDKGRDLGQITERVTEKDIMRETEGEELSLIRQAQRGAPFATRAVNYCHSSKQSLSPAAFLSCVRHQPHVPSHSGPFISLEALQLCATYSCPWLGADRPLTL